MAYQSFAIDLVDGVVDRNSSLPDIFLYDRRTGENALVSRSAAAARETSDSGSVQPVISADGRFVAFRSTAKNLVPGQNDRNQGDDVFLWDRTTGRTTLVSHAVSDPARTGSGPSSFRPFLSANGAFVAFLSTARNLVAGQSGLGNNVFLWERATGAITLVTHAPSSPARAAGASSNLAGLSADGRWLLYGSTGRGLVPGQRDEESQPSLDAFLWDRQTGQSRLLSGAGGSAFRTGNGDSNVQSLSADGSWALITSSATNLLPGVTDSRNSDVFLWNRRTGKLTLVSHAARPRPPSRPVGIRTMR